ncbi:uncharacterized protein METZ01_LOCUS425326 [marine metagenome]|uniref:Uncharacterized protein n=1 Tax=marine metagenome TaxID=408172 RepID=A0A382XMX6_9ZZZZ
MLPISFTDHGSWRAPQKSSAPRSVKTSSINVDQMG